MYDNKHLLSIMWSLIEILMVLKIEKHSVPKRMDLFSFAKKNCQYVQQNHVYILLFLMIRHIH